MFISDCQADTTENVRVNKSMNTMWFQTELTEMS